MGLLFWIACTLWGPSRHGPDPKLEAWREAEAAFAARGEEGGPARAMAALTRSLQVDPRNLVARGLMARLEWTYGLAAEAGLPEDRDPARSHYLAAAEIANSCMQRDPAFSAALAADHGAFTSYGLAALPGEARGCLLWAVAATFALTEQRGPGAMLALWNTPVLLRRAGQLDSQDLEGWILWLEGWSARLASPSTTEDAQKKLRQAAEKNPTQGIFRRYLHATEGLPPLPEDAPGSPQRWENRLIRALSQG